MEHRQWSPDPTKAYVFRCEAFLLRPLTAELLATMRAQLASPLPDYRYLRAIECDMYYRDLQYKEELGDLVLFAERVLLGEE